MRPRCVRNPPVLRDSLVGVHGRPSRHVLQDLGVSAPVLRSSLVGVHGRPSRHVLQDLSAIFGIVGDALHALSIGVSDNLMSATFIRWVGALGNLTCSTRPAGSILGCLAAGAYGAQPICGASTSVAAIFL